MKEILTDMSKHWLYALTFAVLGVAGALSVHLTYNQMQVEAQLIPRALDKVKSAQLPWEQETPDEVKNAGLWLKSYDFVRDFLTVHCSGERREAFCNEYGDADIAPLQLMKSVETQLEDNRLLHIRVRTSDAGTAATLANALAEHIAEHNQARAIYEADQFASQLRVKKDELEGRIKNSLETLSKVSENGFGPTLSQDPQQHLGFLGDLQSKVSEVDLKLAENVKMIRLLAQDRVAAGADYGPSLKIAELTRENESLQERRKAMLGQLRRGLKDSYFTKSGADNLTRVKEEFRSAVDNYTQLVRALDRLQLSASFTQGPIEFFQKASPALARYRWPLSLLIGFGIFLSQVFAVALFLIFRMWEVEAESVPFSRAARQLRARRSERAAVN